MFLSIEVNDNEPSLSAVGSREGKGGYFARKQKSTQEKKDNP